MISRPYILEETDDFAVVFKPPKMHSAPLAKKDGGTLLEWYCEQVSTNFIDGGLMHRLDFETNGLLLFAKNEKSFRHFKNLQDEGGFIKEYTAVCAKNEALPSGFPLPPAFAEVQASEEKPMVIESFFRPFGPGRKQVRPVIDTGVNKEIAKSNGGMYRTEIIAIKDNVFSIRLKRGFRHQIRCHLCWIGYPVLNDPLYLYSPAQEGQILALCSNALFFVDPMEKEREYRISSKVSSEIFR